MMRGIPQCYIPSFVDIGWPVPEKQIFEGFFYHIRAWRQSWSCDPDAAKKLCSPSQRGALIGQAVSEKKIFERCERQKMVLNEYPESVLRAKIRK